MFTFFRTQKYWRCVALQRQDPLPSIASILRHWIQNEESRNYQGKIKHNNPAVQWPVPELTRLVQIGEIFMFLLFFILRSSFAFSCPTGYPVCFQSGIRSIPVHALTRNLAVIVFLIFCTCWLLKTIFSDVLRNEIGRCLDKLLVLRHDKSVGRMKPGLCISGWEDSCLDLT